MLYKTIPIFCYIVLLCFVCISSAQAEQLSYTDAQIKAAFILKLRDFVNWPVSKSLKTVCIVGDGLVGNSLAFTIRQNRNVQLKEIRVVRKTLTSSFSECHLVYFDETSESIFPQILFSLKNQPILTISDLDGFIDREGMIGLNKENRRIVIEINHLQIKKNNLDISSKVLGVSKRVLE